MIFLSLCGLPASGKSTLSIQLAEILNSKLYSCDTFFSVNKGKPNNRIIEEFHNSMCTDLLNGHDIVCDGTYTIERTRLELLHGISIVQCKKIIVVLTTPFEECLHRNNNREVKVSEKDMYSMQKTFVFPTFNEGWDEIIYVNDNNCDKIIMEVNKLCHLPQKII